MCFPIKIIRCTHIKMHGAFYSVSDRSVTDLLEVGMQIGKTKVFLRSHAYEMIEHLRHESMDVAAIKMQSIGRMRLTRNEFLSLRKSSLTVQCFFRQKKLRDL